MTVDHRIGGSKNMANSSKMTDYYMVMPGSSPSLADSGVSHPL